MEKGELFNIETLLGFFDFAFCNVIVFLVSSNMGQKPKSRASGMHAVILDGPSIFIQLWAWEED